MNDKELKKSWLSESGLSSKVKIKQIKAKDEKLKYIQICDSAYTISVLKRNDFSELFEKIHQNAIFLGLEYNSEQAGYVAFYANDIEKKIAFITLICMSTKFQRLHLGSALMERCIQISKELNMEQIKLEVLLRDTVAIGFYKKHGFIQDSVASETSIYMKKKL